MAPTRIGSSTFAKLFTYVAVLALALPANALYFFIEGPVAKCFYEELPKDTLVVGNYEAQQYDPNSNTYQPSPDLGIFISVEETFDNDHRVVAQRGSASGRLTFSAADSGEHRICFTPSHGAANGGWLSGGVPLGGIKLSLDLVIGETSNIESTDKGKMQDIVQKIKDLNGRLQDIKREQVFQREREAEFRDQSETTNAKIVRWALIQLAVLGVTCTWQLSHLRTFFIKQKLT
ncbi:MAG: Transmembrane emp24 domain-containing protein 9 [Cirrosporium novae-zelandiae]|nr:MAG: Transmembrane emp24 domain-containing protein 9 [Cirrosporium novae-zelandiae]